VDSTSHLHTLYCKRFVRLRVLFKTHIKEDSYYSEHSDEDGEELKEAYKILYVEFEKLRETRKQDIHELNSL
jgi:hypothetical protein